MAEPPPPSPPPTPPPRSGGWWVQVVAVEQGREERAFVALDDLERLAIEDAESLPGRIAQLRTMFESWHNRTGGIYVPKTEG